MAAKKYDKYIMKDCVKDIKESKTPVLSLYGERLGKGDVNWSCHWSYITEPFVMVKDTMAHEFDQLLCFIGGDPMNIREFKAEVELTLGEEREIYKINSTSIVYIPAGMMHCPLNFKKIEKPIIYWDIYLAPTYKKRVIDKTK